MKQEFPHLEIVDGWLLYEALLFTSFYRNFFLKDFEFNSLEIGVHHGKFLIGIENITPLNGEVIAVDVFESQEKNIDKSGAGNLEIFNSHVENFCKDPTRVVVRATDSLDINPSEFGLNQFGLLSIDGGHTANHTLHDLEICNLLVSEAGLVILDDILNQDWVGVVTGAVQYFSSNTGKRIVPFAIGYNKLFCCHFTAKQQVLDVLFKYQNELTEIGLKPFKLTEFAGHKVMSFK